MIDNTPHIPKRFSDKIMSHIIKISMGYPSPLLLIIQGEPGIGKSFQTQKILISNNLSYEVIDSSVLAGEHEGDSIKILKEIYIHQSMKQKVSAIIIDDFDMSIANQKNNFSKTSNSDILNTFLMHLCDNPALIDGKKVNPVPLIITGNDFTNMYAPLVRDGRADIFEWSLLEDEKIKIVDAIFSEYNLSKDQIKDLVSKYSTKSISFFKQIKLSFIDNHINDLIAEAKELDFNRNELKKLGEKALKHTFKNIEYKNVLTIAENLNNPLKSYL